MFCRLSRVQEEFFRPFFSFMRDDLNWGTVHGFVGVGKIKQGIHESPIPLN